jgi:hypothetical protein
MSDNLRPRYFHEAFNEPPRREGLSESDPEAADDVRSFRYEVRQEVDEFLRNAQPRLNMEGQSPELYFNYIKAQSFNSSSKLHFGYYFIGIHDGAMRRIVPLARTLAEKPELYTALGFPLTSHPSSQLVAEMASKIARYMVNYTVGHELGHHIHGHTATQSREKIVRHAMEIEADGYSACLSVEAAIADSVAPPDQRTNVRLFFLAAALYLECDDRTIDWSGFKDEDYPPYSIRIEYIQGAILKTLQQYGPKLGGTLDNDIAAELLEVLAGTWNPDSSFPKILRETDDLDESTFAEYGQRLEKTRLRLREELQNLQLKRVGEGCSAIEEASKPSGSFSH